MPLGLTLASDLEGLQRDPGSTAAECAQALASVVGSYASGVVPASLTVTTAQAALQSALTGAMSAASGAGIALMETAFTAFAATVGGGMAPAFVAVPPPAPVGFASLTTATDDPAVAASSLASLIDTWMRTGTATPSGGGAPVLWS